MNMFKKGLALTLAGSLMLSSTSAFAATPVKSVEDKGAVLYELGLVQGYSDTEMVLGLDKEVTREVGVKLVLSMMGYTDIDMTATPSFTDVPANHWSAPYIAFAEENGITSGVSATQFGLGEKVSVRQVVAFMLRALGYDATEAWKNGAELGLGAGIVDSSDLVKFDATALRADFTDIAYDSLAAELVKGGTLAEALVEAGAITEEEAAKFGLVEENKELAVDSIEALNLKQFKVTFTAPVEEKSAIEAKNYDSKKINLRNAKFQLVGDSEVLVTLEKAAGQQAKGSITVEGVKGVEGMEVPTFTADVEFYDAEFPKVDSVEVVGKDTLKVTFTEPMEVPSSTSAKKAPFTLKDESGKKLYVDDVEFVENGAAVMVSFYKDFKDGEYAFEIAPGYKDFAGYTIISYNESIEVAKDTEAPYIVDVKEVKPSKLTLVFNEPLKDLPKYDEVYHTNTNNKALNATDSIKWGENHSEVIVDFGVKNTMPETAYVYVKSEKVEDLWGNKNDTTLKFQVSVVEDNEKPVLEKVELGENQKELVLTFSEDVKNVARGDFELFDDEDKEVKAFMTGNPVVDGKKVTLKLKKAIESGEFTLKAEKIDDIYGNTMDKVDFEFSANDVTAPTFPTTAVLYTDDAEQTLVVTYSEKMDEDSVTNLANYQVELQKLKADKDWEVDTNWETAKLVDLSDISDKVEIRMTSSEKGVEIILDQRDGYRFENGKTLSIARVSDAAGNETEALSKTGIVYSGSSKSIDINTEKGVKEFYVTSETEAKIVLDSPVEDFEADDFVVVVNGLSTAKSAEYFDIDLVSEGDKPEVMIRVSERDLVKFTADNQVLVRADEDTKWDTVTAEDLKVKSAPQDEIGTVNQYGDKLFISSVADPKVAGEIQSSDKFAPALVQDADGNYEIKVTASTSTDAALKGRPVITLTFTEDLAASAYVGHDLEIEKNGDKLIASVDYDAVVAGNTIVVTVKTAEVGFDGDFTVGIKETVNYISDDYTTNENYVAGDVSQVVEAKLSVTLNSTIGDGVADAQLLAATPQTLIFSEDLSETGKEAVEEAIEKAANKVDNAAKLTFTWTGDTNVEVSTDTNITFDVDVTADIEDANGTVADDVLLVNAK